MGRKSLADEWLTKDGLLSIQDWARQGLDDKQIAKNIGVAAGTFYEWKKKYPPFAEALKRGKRPVDVEVENMLLRSAMGFSKTVKEAIKLRQKGGSEIVEYIDREIYIPPNTTAQIFWLKNRRPDLWRDKRDVVTSTPGQLADLIDGLKEPCTYDLHTEAEGLDGTLEDEQAETD